MKPSTTPLPSPIMKFNAEKVRVAVFADRRSMGAAAAASVARHLRNLAKQQERIRVMFACAPSQDEFLAALIDPAVAGDVPWERIVAFHMDDYVGLPGTDPRSFRHYLQEHLVKKVSLAAFHAIRAEDRDTQAECARYAGLLAEAPLDLICLGIGENGHLAFNDPPVADFDDKALVKVVELAPECRHQQVNDGCFPRIEDVPTHAFTVTIPVFRQALRLSCVVPGRTKAAAVKATLNDKISTQWPSTLLRTHPEADLYVDKDSTSLLTGRYEAAFEEAED